MSDKAKILIVDDVKEYRENIKDILKMKDYEVETASNGTKAVNKVKKQNFDLVLMDIKMPVMNGVEAFKKIKKLKTDLPVIMISAFSVSELIKNALRKGACGYISKPIDFDRLFRMIKSATKEGGLIHVIDDEKEFCENVKEILEKKEYNVITAQNGFHALKQAREYKPDIILLDMKLPPINGLDAYLKIRDIRPNAVVILVTGYKKELKEKIKNTLQKSAYTVLEKPINIEKMLELIQKIEKQIEENNVKKPKTK